MTPDLLITGAAAYLFFCAVGVDPKGRARVYEEAPYRRSSGPATVIRDPIYRFFTAGPLLWTIAVLTLSRLGPGACELASGRMSSAQSLSGVLTVLVCAKILFGPVMHVRKSIRRIGDRHIRPFGFIVYDAVRVWPINLVEKLAWKLAMIPALGLIGLILALVNDGPASGAVRGPLAFAWTILCLGRTAVFIVFHRPRAAIGVAWMVGAAVVCLVMLTTVDALLAACGVVPGARLDHRPIVAGLAALPLMEIIAAVLSALL